MSVDVVYDCPMGGSTLRQVSSSQFQEGLDYLAGRASGSGVISDQFLQSGAPVGEVTSMDVGGFLSIFGTTGGKIADGATVQIPYQKRVSGGTFAGAGANVLVKGVLNNPAQLVPMSVNAPAKGACTAQGAVHFLSADGITAPYAVLTGQTLGAQQFNAMYGLGPVFVNGVQVPRQIGFQVNFGVGLSEKCHYDGAVWPSDIFTETFDPTIEFTQEDFDYLSGIAGGGSINSIYAWIRRRASGSTYVADNVANHISFGFTSGVIRAQQVSASETKHGNQAVQVLGRTLLIGNGVTLS